MKNTLTQKEIDLIPIIRDKWLSRAFDGKSDFDWKKIKPHIEWLYGLCKLSSPTVIVLDSPMACQVAANLLKERDQVWAQVGAQVRAQVWAQVGAQVGD